MSARAFGLGAMWLIGALGLARGGLSGAGALAEARRRPPDPSAAPGAMRRLPAGETRLVWQGPERGPVLVLVHGLSTPSEIWEPLAARLGEAGIRTLRYDLYGRGFSARPARRHDAGLYVRQLRDLLDAMGVSAPVAVAGFSMGGALAACFADAHPDRVRGLALIAPAGLTHGLKGLYSLAARVPLLGDALWSLCAGPVLVRQARREAHPAHPGLPGVMAREAGSRGYAPALLSSLRHMPGRPLDDLHGRLAARGLPVLAIWGGHDAVIPPAVRARLAAANPGARSHAIADAGHGLPVTHADAVADRLVPWMQGLEHDI